MSKAKTDKSRKEKLDNFKQKQKQKNKVMSEQTVDQAPQFKPFRQVPHWEPDAEIKITGAQFETLKDFFNIFSEPIQTMQDIFSKNLNDGVIQIKYLDNDNAEISKDEVQGYMLQMREYFAKEAAKSEGVLITSPDVDTPTETKPILTAV